MPPPTLNSEEPVKLKGLTPAQYWDQALQQAA